MSEQLYADPDVITGHTDVICSTSIERIVPGRNAALSLAEILIHQLSDISALTDSIAGAKRMNGECSNTVTTAGLLSTSTKLGRRSPAISIVVSRRI
ncbi:hypothetical protein N4236_03655 [Enterobacter asburiae]|nr:MULTISPECIES: hypothetical protein [Enterobacter]MDW3565702.1 hypothetical protein [Enterobacter asburiae]